MKLRTLIKKLQKLEKEHGGDIEAMIDVDFDLAAIRADVSTAEVGERRVRTVVVLYPKDDLE